MRNAKSKVKHVGYAVEVNRSGEPGLANWEQVGDATYSTRSQALTFLESFLKRFPGTKRSRIFGVRVNVEPLTGHEERSGNTLTRRELQSKFIESQKRRSA